MSVRRKGLLLVVSGPSGVGKGTLIRRVLERRPAVRKSISCTTRDPRPGERGGVDYHFVSEERFAQMRERGELLEWAVVHRDILYGTPRAPVEGALAAGKSIILEIDYQGALSVRAKLGGACALVFVAPPSWEALLARLQGRNTESRDEVLRRVASARAEFAAMDAFEYVIVNERIESAAEQLEQVLLAEQLRLDRCDWRGLQQRLLREAGEQR